MVNTKLGDIMYKFPFRSYKATSHIIIYYISILSSIMYYIILYIIYIYIYIYIILATRPFPSSGTSCASSPSGRQIFMMFQYIVIYNILRQCVIYCISNTAARGHQVQVGPRVVRCIISCRQHNMLHPISAITQDRCNNTRYCIRYCIRYTQ